MGRRNENSIFIPSETHTHKNTRCLYLLLEWAIYVGLLLPILIYVLFSQESFLTNFLMKFFMRHIYIRDIGQEGVLATLRDSLYLSLLLGIKILIEKYPPTASLSGYPNVDILHSLFLTIQR